MFFRARPRPDVEAAGLRRVDRAAPRYALRVLVLTVGLFVLDLVAGHLPALGGTRRLRRAAGAAGAAPRHCRRAGCSGEASPGFCLFVLALAVVVDGVTRHGLADALRAPRALRHVFARAARRWPRWPPPSPTW